MYDLKWDHLDSRYEGGIERGVLYPHIGPGVAWEGLTSVSHIPEFDGDESVYVDGRKVIDLPRAAKLKTTLTAYTYPDEFLQYDGYQQFQKGTFADEQMPLNTFSLSYRTNVDENHFKIHILYNQTATPDTTEYETISDEISASELNWTLSGVPENVGSSRPTTHIYFDSRYLDDSVMHAIQRRLYGWNGVPPAIIRGEDIQKVVDSKSYQFLEIVRDQWTLLGPDEYIDIDETNRYTIRNIEANRLTPTTYQITDKIVP